MTLKNTWASGESFTADDANDVADEVNGAVTALDGKVASARAISAGAGLTGGGDLTANRTLAADFGTGAGKVCEGDDSRLSDARTPTAHNHNASNINAGTLDAARIPSASVKAWANAPRVSSTASSSTPSVDCESFDQFNLTALAVNVSSFTVSGTAVDGQTLIIRVKDNGTTRTLVWPAMFRAIGVTLPAATTASATLYVGARYNAADSKWDVLAVGVEA